MRCTALLATALLSSLAGAQTTWYVDASGTPPGTGTLADPYTDIQYAINQPSTVSGDTILVAPGTYSGTVQFPAFNLKVKSSGGPTVTRIESPGGFAVSMDGLQGGVLEGFHVRTTGGSAVHVNTGSLLRCIIQNVGPKGSSVGVRNEDTCLIRNCTITGFNKAITEFGLGVGGQIYENTLFYGNDVDMVSSNGFAPTHYCSFQNGQPFDEFGCIEGQDPKLWNLAASDFHLAPLSHCIDAGNPSQTDPDGSRVDIGAIPYDPSYAATPTTYCTPKVNSQGCSPTVIWMGTPSLTGLDDFVLIASEALNKKVGKYIWSAQPNSVPFLGGTLCVKLPFVRGPQLNSGGSSSGADCSGSYTWHFSQAYMASKGVTAGQIIYAQAWGRDPGFADPNNSQLSDAIVFQVEL